MDLYQICILQYIHILISVNKKDVCLVCGVGRYLPVDISVRRLLQPGRRPEVGTSVCLYLASEFTLFTEHANVSTGSRSGFGHNGCQLKFSCKDSQDYQ